MKIKAYVDQGKVMNLTVFPSMSTMDLLKLIASESGKTLSNSFNMELKVNGNTSVMKKKSTLEESFVQDGATIHLVSRPKTREWEISDSPLKVTAAEIVNWTPDDVALWLRSVNFGDDAITAITVENELDGGSLLEFNYERLLSDCKLKPGVAMKLSRLISTVKSQEEGLSQPVSSEQRDEPIEETEPRRFEIEREVFEPQLTQPDVVMRGRRKEPVRDEMESEPDVQLGGMSPPTSPLVNSPVWSAKHIETPSLSQPSPSQLTQSKRATKLIEEIDDKNQIWTYQRVVEELLPEEDEDNPESIRKLIRDLFENEIGLVEIDVHSQSIGDNGAKAFAKALEVNHTLVSLNVAANGITSVGASFFAEMLQHNETLKSLILYQSSIASSGIINIARAVKSSKTLTMLDLQENDVGGVGAHEIGECLKRNRYLLTLDLGDCNLGPSGIKNVCEGLKKNSTLTNLYLDGLNQFSSNSFKIIGELLKVNRSLRSLFIGDNKIGSGLKQLLAGLGENATLTELHLNLDQIDVEGAKLIGRYLEKKSALTILDLSGAHAIFSSLRKNKKLNTLNMSGIVHSNSSKANHITSKYVKDIVLVLEMNEILVNLDLRENRLKEKDFKSIQESWDNRQGTLDLIEAPQQQ